MKGYRGDRGDVMFTAVLFAVVAAYIVIAYGYAPDVCEVPLIAGWGTFGFLVLDVASRTPTRLGQAVAGAFRASEGGPGRAPVRPGFRREIDFILWLVALMAGVYLVGFLIALPVFGFAYLVARGGQKPREAFMGAAGLTLFCWVLFEFLMRYELYRGLLLGGDG